MTEYKMKLTPITGKAAEWKQFIQVTPVLEKWLRFSFWKHTTKREVYATTTHKEVLRVLWASGTSRGVMTGNIVNAEPLDITIYKKMNKE